MSKKNLEGKISLEEVLGKFKKHNESFKNNLEKEEAYEDSIETIENIIIRPIICTSCKQSWKYFYGATNEDSPLLEIKRNKGEKGSSPAST